MKEAPKCNKIQVLGFLVKMFILVGSRFLSSGSEALASEEALSLLVESKAFSSSEVLVGL